MYQFDEICHIDFTLSHQIFILTSITSHNDAKGLISLTTHMREPSVWLTLSLHCVRSLYYKHHNLLRSVAQWAVRSTNSLVSLRQSLHWQTEQPFSDMSCHYIGLAFFLTIFVLWIAVLLLLLMAGYNQEVYSSATFRRVQQPLQHSLKILISYRPAGFEISRF